MSAPHIGVLLPTLAVHLGVVIWSRWIRKAVTAAAPDAFMGGSKMRNLYGLPAAAAMLLSISLPAQAMPFASGSQGDDSALTFVRDGCGPFGHRSHYGYCKENGDSGYTYDPGEYHGGYGQGGYGFAHRREFYDEDGYRERRCFIKDTWDGPVRICR